MRTFFISDTHFGHHNIYTFVDEKGERITPVALDDVLKELERKVRKG